MSVAIVTGSSGLVGSETVKFLCDKGFDVIGIDNDMRSYFFGKDGSTNWLTNLLIKNYKNYTHYNIDIRNIEEIKKIFNLYKDNISTIIHCAAQPSHDWAAKEPITDFEVNALGTINLLELTRQICPDASFIFMSTNKVYGDSPNFLPLEIKDTRIECNKNHRYFEYGIDESMSIDQSKHSVFGASKIAADIMCQEYGKYFGLKIGIFRGGCLTGPYHSGVELHGFLSYLIKCQLTNKIYNIYGYNGKQVRDNIHSFDLINAFWYFLQNPKYGEVYNIGGSRFSNCSIIEASQIIEKITNKKLNYINIDDARSGDHMWWISDTRKFQKDYPEWKYTYSINLIINDIIEAIVDREGIIL
jgi:CDP-paratose 2-epimerase